jgi:ribosomal protein L7/L12
VDFIARSARFPSDSRDLPAQAISQIRDLLSQDRRIQAVKLVRVLTRWGLRESKDYVDSLMPR